MSVKPDIYIPPNHYWSSLKLRRSYLRSHVIFSIQALDHAPRGCCLLSTSHSLGILVLQRTGCHWQAFSYHRCSSHIRNLIHGYRYCPPRYLVTLSLSLSASFNRAYTFGPHPVVLQTTSLYHCRSTVPSSLPQSSQSLKLSSRSHPVAVYAHLRCRPLHSRHESQHPSLAGARPLERAYCHDRVT